MDGASADVVAAYLSGGRESGTAHRRQKAAAVACIMSVEVFTSEGGGLHAFGLPLKVRVVLSVAAPVWGATLSFQICDDSNRPVTHVWIQDSDLPFCRAAGTEVSSARCRSRSCSWAATT